MNNSNKMTDIVNLDKNKITLKDIEFIAINELSEKEYISKYGINLYSNILLRITHKYFGEYEAHKLWNKILNHRENLILTLDRNPGIMVTSLDYLTNTEHLLDDVTIIEEDKSEYIITTNLFDKLTKLFVRGVFDVIVLKEYDLSIRANIPLSLLMIDVDDFKYINDNYGHQRGDETLSIIGDIILKSIRSMDIGARYGGEEFSIIMPSTASIDAKTIAERIRRSIEVYDFSDFTITVSIGISTLLNNETSLTDFIYMADKALSHAKITNKNKVVHYSVISLEPIVSSYQKRRTKMNKIKIELIFDDKQSIKTLAVYNCEFEQLMHNKEIISDDNHYVITSIIAINEGDELWYRLSCNQKGGLSSSEL